jgi:DNA-directed RNA polymerase subunit H (RpoH/RPB5)
MASNQNFEMSDLEIQHNCIGTIINMLIARKWTTETADKLFSLIADPEELIDSKAVLCDVINKRVAIKFYNYKLTTMKNDKEIDTFIANYPGHHRILIVYDILSKAEIQIKDTKDFEVFKTMEIVRDISKHFLVPKHILLSKEEAEQFMEEYSLKKRDMGRIFIDDPMVRYLYAKKDDIIQIIRGSLISGYSTYYRLVVSNSIYG